MKRYTQLTLSVSMVAFVLLVFSCSKQVFDVLDHCARGIYLHLFAQTECAETPSFPEAIQHLEVYAFDANDRFVQEVSLADVKLDPKNETLIPLTKAGTYTLVVWGTNDKTLFSAEPLKVGETTKKDLLKRLNTAASGSAIDLKGKKVYVGTTSPVSVGEYSDFFAKCSANMREITNRVNVRIEGVENSSDLDIQLLSDNVSYAVDGSLLPYKQMSYPTTLVYPSEKEVTASFNTLKLESGRASVLRVTDKKTGKVVYNEDLVGTILLSPNAANINLRCLNDYDVVLRMRCCTDCETGYMMITLHVNNWLVHSYDADLGV